MSAERWLAARHYLNAHRHELARAAAGLYPAAWRVAGTVMLAPPRWRAGPVELDRVTLAWQAAAAPAIDGTGPATEGVRPLRPDGRRYASYAAALSELSRPGLLANRVCYRLVGLTSSRLDFGTARYFDLVSTCEAVAHEYAAAALARGGRPAGRPELPFRSLIGDPADLSRRPVLTAVATLVLRRDRDPQMILHWRDAARVASGGGLYQVAPVGMFQPSDDAVWNHANDFSLWRCIVRELAEELLGGSEDYGSDTAPIDYQNWPLQARLAAARRAGTLRVYWLGAGLDPLTLVCDQLTVAVFDAPLFDAVFAGLAGANDEGRILAGPFTAATVRRFAGREAMQPAGAALLSLAWRHRRTLLA
jgi:hypothetical protein